ncbi:MAG TPA: hypothetical protein VGH39_08165, partial [Xanthobacteraceae bacterium]
AGITGRADEARARMRRAIATIEDDAYARALVQQVSSYLHVMLREPEQVTMQAAQAIATADGHGFRLVGWWARIAHGWAQAQLDHLKKGASLINEALAAYRADGYLLGVPMFLTLLAEAQAVGGALAESLRTLEEALTVRHYPGAADGRTRRSKITHPCQPSPIPLSGRPAHRPFRGLLGVSR